MQQPAKHIAPYISYTLGNPGRLFVQTDGFNHLLQVRPRRANDGGLKEREKKQNKKRKQKILNTNSNFCPSLCEVLK